MAYEEDWELSSGFALDGATGPIIGAEFGFNNSIGAGVVCLNLTVDPANGEEPVEQSFSVGGKWEANRDGSMIEGGGKINNNSTLGILMASIIEVFREKGLDPGEEFGEGGPRVAANWLGKVFTWDTITIKTTNPTTGVEKDTTKFIINDYHGAGEGEVKASKPAASKPSGAAKKSGGTIVGGKKAAPAEEAAEVAAEVGSTTEAPDGIGEELWLKLLNMANEAEDHESFAEAALEDSDVDGNKAAMKAVMSTKDGSVWAVAKG